MKKRIFSVLLAVLMLTALLAGCGAKPAPVATGTPVPEAEPAEPVTLTMGSWRTDDVAQMTALLAAYKEVAPNVTIEFQPTNPPDYNATLRTQLDSGTGPDLMYARSYATGIELFDAGYFADCSAIPGLMENFTPSNLAPWQTADGKMFAVPFAAVSHAVYYNKDVFAKEGLAAPATWEEFMTLCQTLKDKGYTPLANGVADEWDILETFFLGMLPNYIGGATERVKYEAGEKAVNDEAFVNAYTDIAGVAPFLPTGFEAVTYNDSQALFSTQKAVMFIDGSWTAGVYADAEFDWGVFAIPAREGGKTAICFHPDMAITMNAGSENLEACTAFLTWLASPEGATVASANLPVGYFPMINTEITLADPHANEFLSLNQGKETDARFVWPALMDLYAPMNQAVIGVLKGTLTPQAAADSVVAAQTAEK
ncbi:MAG: extracellular solute-binding protein [Oscillospiraceae bacterium]